jgi:autophagy-related protein 16-1
MNEANEFYEDMRSKHQNVLSWRDGSNGAGDQMSATTSESGNEDAKKDEVDMSAKDGTPSPPGKNVDLTPNG